MPAQHQRLAHLPSALCVFCHAQHHAWYPKVMFALTHGLLNLSGCRHLGLILEQVTHLDLLHACMGASWIV